MSMGADRIHLRVLREWFMSVQSCSLLSERLWQQAEVSGDWRRANAMPIFKKGKEGDLCYCRLVGLTSGRL